MDYKIELQNNNIDLQSILNTINSLPDANRGLTEEEAQAMVNEAIGNLKLQSKTVTPTDAEQTITADEGYFGLASVIVEAAEGGDSAPDGTDVTFGNVDGAPVEREEAYTILSVNLNELGRITQAVAGKSELMTIDEMLYHLDRAKFVPQGFASSVFDMGTISFTSSAVGVLQEG